MLEPHGRDVGMYALHAPVALRDRILRFVQRREGVIVGIRLLVELIANDPPSTGHVLLMLVEHKRGSMTSSFCPRARSAAAAPRSDHC